MTSKAERLWARVDAIYWNEMGEHDEWDTTEVFRAICDELGITEDMVEKLELEQFEVGTALGSIVICDGVRALRALLEAAGEATDDEG